MNKYLRPGLICRIVKSPENSNRLVETVRPFRGVDAWWCVALQTIHCTLYPSGRLGMTQPGGRLLIRSDRLQPLHDGDGRDESLSWSEVPSAAEVPV